MKAYQHLAELQEAEGELEGTLESYRQLLELDRSQAWVRRRIRVLSESGAASLVKRALDLMSQGEHQQALPLLNAGYEKQPNDPDVLFNLAFCYQKLGRRERAIRFYDELLRLVPDQRQGNFNQAYACLEGNQRADWTRSVALFEKVIEIDSNYTEALHHLASAHWKL